MISVTRRAAGPLVKSDRAEPDGLTAPSASAAGSASFTSLSFSPSTPFVVAIRCSTTLHSSRRPARSSQRGDSGR
eukprot:scaffold128412_cov63-Phaeocystis_antarctica.AAC.3